MLVLQKRIRLLRDEAKNNEQRTMHFDIVLNSAATQKFVQPKSVTCKWNGEFQ